MKYFTWQKLKFNISNINVYPPKPATVLLAEVACNIVQKGESFLEIGTGSGFVGIAVSRFVKNSKVTVSDINLEAISVAKENAILNKVSIQAVQGDMYKPFKNKKFDVIAVHPPAIPYLFGKTWGMSTGMTVATNGGLDGSDLVVESILGAKNHLTKNGKLLLLLPHWSNANKAYDVLLKNYKNITRITEKEIEFFAVTEGSPSKEILDYTLELARTNIIELRKKNKKIFSRASVIQAFKK